MDVSIAVSAKGFPLRFPCYQRQVGIDERENSIDLQFPAVLAEITGLQTIRYNTLKKDLFLNALTGAEKNIIWLPIVTKTWVDGRMSHLFWV